MGRLAKWLKEEVTGMTADTLVRLKLFTRNARLIDTRAERGWAQARVASWVSMTTQRLSDIENLKVIPTDLEMDDLSAVLMKSVEYLFPKVLAQSVSCGVFDKREVSLSEKQVAALESREVVLALPATEDIEMNVDRLALVDKVKEVIGGLTPREQKIIELRFGLNGGQTHTLEDIGKMFNVTRDRIRQIEEKALRKLRHPTRSRKLQVFLDD